ncbi:MAG TPA: hypothetical protein PKW66_28920, partial [Polyangiaceae bacterium]|nr:hypothetical protein [Polyangiaceae bacterium]
IIWGSKMGVQFSLVTVARMHIIVIIDRTGPMEDQVPQFMHKREGLLRLPSRLLDETQPRCEAHSVSRSTNSKTHEVHA